MAARPRRPICSADQERSVIFLPALILRVIFLGCAATI